MKKAASELRFEEAAFLRDKIRSLEALKDEEKAEKSAADPKQPNQRKQKRR